MTCFASGESLCKARNQNHANAVGTDREKANEAMVKSKRLYWDSRLCRLKKNGTRTKIFNVWVTGLKANQP